MKNAKVEWNNEHMLRALVAESNSRSEVLKKLGLIPSSNMVTLRKYLKRYGISTGHFDPSLDRPTRRNGPTQLPIDQLLIKGRPISDRYGIKQRLIRDKILPYECEKCHIGDKWYGEPLTLQLEHKNGDNTDYRIENLCFLCPNCHSQTPTFAGRNKKIIAD